MAFCRTYGKCHVISLPMGIDRAFWEVLSNYAGTVLRNAGEWAAGGPAALQLKATVCWMWPYGGWRDR
jgi:hypothetical protein